MQPEIRGGAERAARGTSIATPAVLPRWLLAAALVLAGALHAGSVAWPWGGQALWWLQLLALAAGVWLIGQPVAGGDSRKRAFRAGFLRGWLFALAWLCTTFWWLYVSMHTYGGMPPWLAGGAVVLLAAGLSLYYALAAGLWLAWRKAHPFRPWGGLLFAALWLLAELCRGVLFTGFPWGAAGYAHVDGPLSGFAPWLGVYGIGFVAAWFAAGLGQMLWKLPLGHGAHLPSPATPRGTVVLALGTLGLGLVLQQAVNPGLTRSAGDRPLRVELLQGNIPQNEKFHPNGGVLVALEWYGAQLGASSSDLVVIPETAIPMLPQQLPPDYWQALQHRFAMGDQAALLGMPAGNADTGYANAVVGMAPGGVRTIGGTRQAELALPPAALPEYSYAKHHLVPFGEFIPYGFQWFVDMMQMPLGNFQRGALSQPRLLWQNQRIQPNICYEDLFGEELAASFGEPGVAPTVLVNVSNIAWFGDTVAIDQHRHISRMRAIELGRPMLRATNTGATAIIDHAGRVQQELPRLQRAVLFGEVEGRDGVTPFAWWAARMGLAPLWLLGLIVAAVLLLGLRRR